LPRFGISDSGADFCAFPDVVCRKLTHYRLFLDLSRAIGTPGMVESGRICIQSIRQRMAAMAPPVTDLGEFLKDVPPAWVAISARRRLCRRNEGCTLES